MWKCQSGAGQDRCSKLASPPVTSEVMCSITGQAHSSCDAEGDSLWQRKFPPGAPVSSHMHYKSPNIVYGANNVLVDAQLSIQYLKIGKCRIFLTYRLCQTSQVSFMKLNEMYQWRNHVSHCIYYAECPVKQRQLYHRAFLGVRSIKYSYCGLRHGHPIIPSWAS
jgi:hypothetical protein